MSVPGVRLPKPSTTTTNLYAVTLPSSMNIKDDPSELPDNEAQYLQDWFLHTPGVLIQRGAILQGNVAFLPTTYCVGAVTTKNPQGVSRVLYIN